MMTDYLNETLAEIIKKEIDAKKVKFFYQEGSFDRYINIDGKIINLNKGEYCTLKNGNTYKIKDFDYRYLELLVPLPKEEKELFFKKREPEIAHLIHFLKKELKQIV